MRRSQLSVCAERLLIIGLRAEMREADRVLGYPDHRSVNRRRMGSEVRHSVAFGPRGGLDDFASKYATTAASTSALIETPRLSAAL